MAKQGRKVWRALVRVDAGSRVYEPGDVLPDDVAESLKPHNESVLYMRDVEEITMAAQESVKPPTAPPVMIPPSAPAPPKNLAPPSTK